MVIEWSNEDQTCIVLIPEFPGDHKYGDNYEETVLRR